MDFCCEVNGLEVRAHYEEREIRELFLPFLEDLIRLREEKRRRILVLLSAPPATGKSTLSLFLRELYREHFPDGPSLEILGMDGFHYRNAYLDAHFTERKGEKVSLRSVKGAPETFDTEALRDRLGCLMKGEFLPWPVYDRRLHEPTDVKETVTGEILLLEGNYFLLREEAWKSIRALSDRTVRIIASPELLRSRLIRRKIAGGLTAEEATAFVEQSDLENIRLCLEESVPGDLQWELTESGIFRAACREEKER